MTMANHETAFSMKLAAKGISPINVKFQIALAEFQNNGGEYSVALAMLNAAYGKGSEGQRPGAEHGWSSNADASQPDAAKGRESIAAEARKRVPDAATERSAGLPLHAIKAVGDVPVASPPKPGHAKRGLSSIGAVQEAVAKSLFDTVRLPDGRSLREIAWSECPMLAAKYRRLSRILMAIHGHAQPADPADGLDKVVTEDGLKEIIGTVEKFNDIH